MYAVMHAILLCVFPFKVQYANPKSKEKPPLHSGGFRIFFDNNSANFLNTLRLQKLFPQGFKPGKFPGLKQKRSQYRLFFL